MRLWNFIEKGNPEMIGLALFLINEENEREIGIRFRVNSWGKENATEITKGMLDNNFVVLKSSKTSANLNI